MACLGRIICGDLTPAHLVYIHTAADDIAVKREPLLVPQRDVMPMVQVKGQALTIRVTFGAIDEESLPPTGAESEYLVRACPYASCQID